MKRWRLLTAMSAVLLLTISCGSDAPTAADDDVADAGEEGTAASPDAGKDAGGRASGRGAGQTVVQGEGAENDTGSRVAGGGGGSSGEGGEDDASSSWYPQQGIYTYSQSGWEEFCDATSCDRQDLPATQDVKTTYKERSSSEVIVVTEAEASNSRTVRTTTRHTPEGAFVTNVYLKFNYQNASFNNSYEPEPPVEIVRLPLQAGMQWAGEWEDRTSGDYEIAVGEREAVKVAGQTVQAFPLHTLTHFRGDFDGTSEVTVWVDPATASVVKTRGTIDVDSFFGTYKTEFTTTLKEGPAYH